MATLHCADCNRSYGAVTGHCAGGRYEGCCRSFATVGGFDAHRVGSVARGDRRCATDAELINGGWTIDNRGWWHVPRDRELEPAFWVHSRELPEDN